MHLLAYWRLDNYLRDLDEGAGFNFNSKQSRLHSAIESGESLWLFTSLKNPPRLFLVARLVVRSKTVNAPGYQYGDYRIWGDFNQSRYFRVRPEEAIEEAFDCLRSLQIESGSLAGTTQQNFPQFCQTMRGVTEAGHNDLLQFTANIPTETRAVQVADEYQLEKSMEDEETDLEALLIQNHLGASVERRRSLLESLPRNRLLVGELHARYTGRCQLCGFDAPIVYGVPAAEAHHINYLSRGGEDTLENLVLLCPNHHTVIHKSDARFDYSRLVFDFPNHRTEPLCLNTHLTRRVPSTSMSTPGCVDVPIDPTTLAEVIRSQLTDDLLTKEWATRKAQTGKALAGFCYVASEAYFHLCGGNGSGLSVYRCSLPDGGTHWWLVATTGERIDITAEQFDSPPPYESGIRAAFLILQRYTTIGVRFCREIRAARFRCW